MSSKNRNRGHGAGVCLDASAARREVERLIAKRDFKEAVKQAKLCFRLESSPDHHRLLEQAYLQRAQELHRGGMPTASAEVAGHLLEFTVTDSTVLEQLILLLPSVGLADKALALSGRLNAPELQLSLSLKVADQAVLHPERAPASNRELREEALAVRRSLAALDAGDEPQAFELLRQIPRSSPLADWRYFVRGLAAFRRGAAEDIAANWDRLDRDRAAFRIARAIGGLAAKTSGTSAESGARLNLSAVETQVFGEPILHRLEQLRQAVTQRRWPDVLRALSPLSASLRRIDIRLAERLTVVLLDSLFNELKDLEWEQSQRLVNEFTRAAQPLPLDPRWNRLRAMNCEFRRDCTIDDLEENWQSYITDLGTVAQLKDEDRPRVQALVHRHLAEVFALEAEPSLDWMFDHDEDPELARDLRREAVLELEKSLRLDSERLETYQLLIDFHQTWKELDLAAAAAGRLIEKFPTDVDTLSFLAKYYSNANEPEKAIPLIDRACSLRPLDESLGFRAISLRQSSARQHALAGRWEEGRADFACVAASAAMKTNPVSLLGRMAAFELKAGEMARAEELIQEARAHSDDPALLWLIMSIEADRYHLPLACKWRFSGLLNSAISGKVRSETAAELATLLAAYVVDDIRYASRPEHVDALLTYLKRASRTKFRHEDMKSVCRFLHGIPEARALYQKMVKRGIKSFPTCPWLLMMDAATEIEKGPRRANIPRLLKQLEKALALAESSTDPDAPTLAETIRESLTMVRNFAPPDRGFPFFGGGGRGRTSSRGALDFIESYFANPDDSEDSDESSDNFFFGPGRPPAAGPRRQPR